MQNTIYNFQLLDTKTSVLCVYISKYAAVSHLFSMTKADYTFYCKLWEHPENQTHLICSAISYTTTYLPIYFQILNFRIFCRTVSVGGFSGH